MKLLDKDGYPVIFIKGKLLINFIRAIIHTNLYNTLLNQKRFSSGKKIKIFLDGKEVAYVSSSYDFSKNISENNTLGKLQIDED